MSVNGREWLRIILEFSDWATLVVPVIKRTGKVRLRDYKLRSLSDFSSLIRVDDHSQVEISSRRSTYPRLICR